jgi:serine/threonine-protein kinase
VQVGRYEILETLGRGASSRVAKACDTLIGRTVALKTFPEGPIDPAWRERFLSEARVLGKLSHAAIVDLYDIGIDDAGAPYLVMEYVPGKPLDKVLEKGTIPFPKACAWAGDLAEALACAHHNRVVHGDVKPANIIVSEAGRVKLSDFGIAGLAMRRSGTGQVLGTPAYMSPEQFMGRPISNRSDLFSLGVVLYEMLTGQRPFDGGTFKEVGAQILSATPQPPSRINRTIPQALDSIVLRCLAKDPEARYASGDELAAELFPHARRKAEAAPAAEPVPAREFVSVAAPRRRLPRLFGLAGATK